MAAPKDSPFPKFRPEGLGSRNPLTGDMSPVTDAQLATIKAIEDKYGISKSDTKRIRMVVVLSLSIQKVDLNLDLKIL